MAARTVGNSDKWMKGSPLKGALLALALELAEPTHRYGLATLLAERVEPAIRVEIDSVYKMLEALENAGLVAHELRENAKSNLRTQKVYGPTELTERAVSRWMSAPVSEVGFRPELVVRIAFARPKDVPVLLDALHALEQRRMDRLKECQDATAPVSSWTELAANVASTWTQEHLHADLRWIMVTRDWLREYATQHGVFPR